MSSQSAFTDSIYASHRQLRETMQHLAEVRSTLSSAHALIALSRQTLWRSYDLLDRVGDLSEVPEKTLPRSAGSTQS